MQLYFCNLSDLEGKRWDTNYWRRDLLVSIEQIQQFKLPVHKISDIAYVTIGQSGKRTFVEDEDVQYLVVGDLVASGVYYNKKPRYVAENSFNDPQRSRIQNEDLLVVISGGGSIGRSTMAYDVNGTTNISQDMALVRLNDFPIYSSLLFLQSKWGVAQILRFENGTGVTHLNQDEVKEILIPKFSEDINQWCKLKWEEIQELHRHAMTTKDKNDWDNVDKKRLKLVEQFENKAKFFIKR